MGANWFRDFKITFCNELVDILVSVEAIEVTNSGSFSIISLNVSLLKFL